MAAILEEVDWWEEPTGIIKQLLIEDDAVKPGTPLERACASAIEAFDSDCDELLRRVLE